MLHPILQQYIRVSEFLSNVIGNDYSILLYDLSRPYPQLVSSLPSTIVINDDDLNNLIKKAISSKDNIINESLYIKQNKALSASCMLIYQSDVLLGMLCILFDDMRYKNICQQILQLCNTSAPSELTQPTKKHELTKYKKNDSHTSVMHTELVARDAAIQALQTYGVCASRLTSDERLEIIKKLDKGGIFLLKGAVKDVATVLECSSASIYRYLSQIRIDSISIFS